jgi:hypothetical protein
MGANDRWYKTIGWQKRRNYQLMIQPLCVMCLAESRNTPATVADHIERHGGDYNAFVLGKLQSLCADCHNVKKQRLEHVGFHGGCDLSGWPTDPRHPSNLMLNECAESKQATSGGRDGSENLGGGRSKK